MNCISTELPFQTNRPPVTCLSGLSAVQNLQMSVCMKRNLSLALILLPVILVTVIVWQRIKLSDLEEQLADARAELQRRQPSPRTVMQAPVASVPSPTNSASPKNSAGPVPSAVTKRSGTTAEEKAASEAKRAAFEQQLAEERKAEAVTANPPLTPERRKALLEGREIFNPGAIEESKVPVTDQTPLRPGQALQVSYAGTWYAAEVVGIEGDGGIHIKYFGWGSNWDEIVPRSDLRLDPQARERAVEKFGARVQPGG